MVKVVKVKMVKIDFVNADVGLLIDLTEFKWEI